MHVVSSKAVLNPANNPQPLLQIGFIVGIENGNKSSGKPQYKSLWSDKTITVIKVTLQQVSMFQVVTHCSDYGTPIDIDIDIVIDIDIEASKYTYI